MLRTKEKLKNSFMEVEYVKNFIKRHGLKMGLKYIIFRIYYYSKILFVNLKKENLVIVNGYKLKTIPNDIGISTELLILKTHEPLTTKILENELREDMICLDIGSNIGYYALLECRKTRKVIAIEPAPLNFSFLRKNIKLNNFKNIDTISLAFSDIDGEVPFLLHSGSNCCRVVDKKEAVHKGEVIKVKSETLDQFCSELSCKIDFLRMDVEGHELHIVKGGLNTIKKFKPMILMEVHRDLIGLNSTITLLHILRNIGYHSKFFIPKEFDIPPFANIKHIQSLNIDNIIKGLIERKLYFTFNILLLNNNS